MSKNTSFNITKTPPKKDMSKKGSKVSKMSKKDSNKEKEESKTEKTP